MSRIHLAIHTTKSNSQPGLPMKIRRSVCRFSWCTVSIASYLFSWGLLVPLPVLAVPRILDAAAWPIASPLWVDWQLHDWAARVKQSAPPRSSTYIHQSVYVLPPASLVSFSFRQTLEETFAYETRWGDKILLFEDNVIQTVFQTQQEIHSRQKCSFYVGTQTRM